jgi:hypothetical protein
MEICDGAIIKCNYELCVKVVNISNIEYKTPSTVTHTLRGNMILTLFIMFIGSHLLTANLGQKDINMSEGLNGKYNGVSFRFILIRLAFFQPR